MSRVRFLCLANSKKYTQRCIAGIRLQPTLTGKHNIARHPDGRPMWIRPVSASARGEIAESTVRGIQLLDIVELNIGAAVPHGHQSENCLFQESEMRSLRAVPPTTEILEKLVTPAPAGLFSDGAATISVEAARGLDYSLLFVRVTNAAPHFAETGNARVQVRLRFRCEGQDYNLPVTDIDFRNRFYREPFILRGKAAVYCTISLGQEYKGQYYKLVAGVLYC